MRYHPSDKWLLAAGAVTILVDKRATLLAAALVALLAVAAAASLGAGSSWQELAANDAATRMILFEIRLPRIVATLVAGFALGLAGCVSQTIFANRLATPDVLGINEGATLAIVAFVTLAAAGAWPFWIAPLGALLAVGILYKTCAAGNDNGPTLIVSGVCLAELLRAVVELLMSMGALHEVQSIYVWLQGSFIGQGYETSLPVFALIVAMAPLLVHLARHLEVLRLPPGVATGVGVDVVRLRRVGVATIALLAALGASIGGPVAFVAMAAPLLVSLLVKDRTPALWCSGLLGAVILQTADTLARTIVAPQEIAAGVVTRIAGGVLLIFLLTRAGRR